MPKMYVPTELKFLFQKKEFILAGSRALKIQNKLGRQETHDFDVIVDYKYFKLVKDKYAKNTMYRRDFPIIICEERGLKTDLFFRKDYDFLMTFEEKGFKILQWQEIVKEKLILIEHYKKSGNYDQKDKHVKDVQYILDTI